MSLRVATTGCVLVALIAPAPTAAAAKPCSGANRIPTARTIVLARTATLCLLNRQRTRRGRRALRPESHLTAAARGHSRDMVRRHYFEHGDFVARVIDADYVSRGQSYALGENIAWGSGQLATPARIVRAWMNSAGHRANILDGRFRDIGVGIAVGAPHPTGGMPAATYTTDFGMKR